MLYQCLRYYYLVVGAMETLDGRHSDLRGAVRDEVLWHHHPNCWHCQKQLPPSATAHKPQDGESHRRRLSSDRSFLTFSYFFYPFLTFLVFLTISKLFLVFLVFMPRILLQSSTFCEYQNSANFAVNIKMLWILPQWYEDISWAPKQRIR